MSLTLSQLLEAGYHHPEFAQQASEILQTRSQDPAIFSELTQIILNPATAEQLKIAAANFLARCIRDDPAVNSQYQSMIQVLAANSNSSFSGSSNALLSRSLSPENLLMSEDIFFLNTLLQTLQAN